MNRQVHFNFQRQLSRRAVLRGLGVSLSLPWLSAMRGTYAAAAATAVSPQRFVATTLGLGLLGEQLNPAEAGRDYTPSPYLAPLQDIRQHMTVISGTSLPGVNGGHRAEACILTGNPVASTGRGRNSISIDQLMAKYRGGETRYSSLVLARSGNDSPSYTENGAMIAAEDSPSKLFRELFVDATPEAARLAAQRSQQGRSIMDAVSEDAKRLERQLGSADRDRLDAYFTGVRELEQHLQAAGQWATRPKPHVEASVPIDIRNGNDLIGQERLMNSVIKLALKTDSTRFITYHLGSGNGVLPLEGVDEGYHSLSHHGQDDEKLDQLEIVEAAIINAWGDLIRDLAATEEGDATLLDRTSLLLTSNLGNASNHDNRNLPVVLAGGPFDHGQHLAFDRKNNYPLSDLYVSLLQAVGVETDQFASSSRTMDGLRFRPTAGSMTASDT